MIPPPGYITTERDGRRLVIRMWRWTAGRRAELVGEVEAYSNAGAMGWGLDMAQEALKLVTAEKDEQS